MFSFLFQLCTSENPFRGKQNESALGRDPALVTLKYLLISLEHCGVWENTASDHHFQCGQKYEKIECLTLENKKINNDSCPSILSLKILHAKTGTNIFLVLPANINTYCTYWHIHPVDFEDAV